MYFFDFLYIAFRFKYFYKVDDEVVKFFQILESIFFVILVLVTFRTCSLRCKVLSHFRFLESVLFFFCILFYWLAWLTWLTGIPHSSNIRKKYEYFRFEIVFLTSFKYANYDGFEIIQSAFWLRFVFAKV